MASNISVEMTGLESTEAYISGMPKRVNTRTQSKLHQWGREFVILGKLMSPEDRLRNIDSRRRPAGQRFKLQWRYQVQQGAQDIVLQVGNVDPKMEWIIFPTKPRGVIPTGGEAEMVSRGYPLRFFTYGGGMYRQWAVRGGVASSGTPGNPVHERMLSAFDLGDSMAEYATWIIKP